MQEIKIDPRSKVRFVFGDSDQDKHEVEKPKNSLIRDFEKRMIEAKREGTALIEIMSDFIVACGLPRQIVDDLSAEGLQQVLEALMPEKKRN